MYRHQSLQEGLVIRASSDSRLVSQLSSATSLVRVDSAELPQLTEPETIHKVVKKIKAMYGSCSSEDSGDVVHMLGSIQVTGSAAYHQLIIQVSSQDACNENIRTSVGKQSRKAAAAYQKVMRPPKDVHETSMRLP